jgi:RND superfamily putative drug exporter
MTPSIAALLGRWFWWPQVVRQRPVRSPWPAPRDDPRDEHSPAPVTADALT